MQIYKERKEDGVVIQIKKKNHKSGNKTKSITVYGEQVNIAFGRILDLYEQLGENDEVTIRHKK